MGKANILDIYVENQFVIPEINEVLTEKALKTAEEDMLLVCSK